METVHGKMIIIISTMIAQTMGIAHLGSFISRLPFMGYSSRPVCRPTVRISYSAKRGQLQHGVYARHGRELMGRKSPCRG